MFHGVLNIVSPPQPEYPICGGMSSGVVEVASTNGGSVVQSAKFTGTWMDDPPVQYFGCCQNLLVSHCRTLPSFAVITPPAPTDAARTVGPQSLNVAQCRLAEGVPVGDPAAMSKS